MFYWNRYCNTFEDYCTFVNETKVINANNTYMTSVDIKNLFTNVSLKQVIQICVDMLYSSNKRALKRENFIQLMKVPTEQVEFSFNKLMYRQIDGIATINLHTIFEPYKNNYLQKGNNNKFTCRHHFNNYDWHNFFLLFS